MTTTTSADVTTDQENPVTVHAIEAPRSIDLQTLVDMLTTQHAAKCDMIVPATAIRAKGGKLVVSGAELVMDENGVTDPNGTYETTDTLDDGVSEKLDIPRGHLRKLHTNRPDLWDSMVNGLLHGKSIRRANGETETIHEADQRSFLLRTFVSEDRRVARALLSDRYEIIDNLDILTAVLTGVRDSGVQVDVSADVTDRRMYVRLVAPGVSVLASELLKGYRSPFASPDIQRAGALAATYGGTDGNGNAEALNAGLVIGNSETGDGGWTLTPRAEFPVCRNGMVVKADMLRGVHLGGKKREGVIVWTEDTREKELAVITAKVRDAVQQFLSTDYLEATIARIREDMQVPVTGAEKHVQAVAKRLAFAPEVTQGVLDHFITGGQLTAGGVMQAVTSYAQTVSDADLAAELEEMALDVLGASAQLARAAR